MVGVLAAGTIAAGASAQPRAGDILVVDTDASPGSRAVLFQVDPQSGARTVLSDFGGSNPTAVAVEADGGILVADPDAGTDPSGGTSEWGALYRIVADPVTGELVRTILTDFGTGARRAQPVGRGRGSVTRRLKSVSVRDRPDGGRRRCGAGGGTRYVPHHDRRAAARGQRQLHRLVRRHTGRGRTSNFNCGGNDSIGKGGADPDRESYTVDISSVPIGAMITSVAVTVRDGAPADVGGTYQTFVRINTTDTNSGVNLAATAELFDECSETKTQTIDVPDVVKSATTTLEIGVVKTPPDGSAIRVGTITATVTYNQPPSAPTLSSPADGSTIVDTTPTFDWSDATDPDTGDAVTYDLQADNSDCDFLSPELNETGLAASTFTPGSPLIPGIYCWRARAVDDGNLASDWSGTWTLTVADPPTLFVITNVVNDDGGTLGASDFTMDVAATNPSPASFPGKTPRPPGDARPRRLRRRHHPRQGYDITSFSPDCGGQPARGTIAAGETKTCTVTANDLPTRGTLFVITTSSTTTAARSVRATSPWAWRPPTPRPRASRAQIPPAAR